MTDFIIAVICLVLALVVLMLRKAYFSVPIFELKRRAAANDVYAKRIYPLVAYGSAFRLLLWLLLAVFTAASLVLFARIAPVWFGIILVAILLWLVFSWLPNAGFSKFNRDLARLTVAPLELVLRWTYPVINYLAKLDH